MCSVAQAASLGHSRVVSALGQPLHINVPIIELTADDLRTLAVAPAPAPAWVQAGLTPPVDLNTLQLRLADGYAPGTKVVELRSSQPFDKAVADVLLDVRTASGQQRYQVSLLTQGGTGVAAAQRSAEMRGAGSATSASALPAQRAISVKRGDTMFAIARRHAVQGVTVYQMMIALQKANPQAFIHDNINLVKAGATLQMPDMAALTAISDREARRLFMKQAHEFALYRQRAAGSANTVSQDAAASGVVSTQGAVTAQEPAGTPRDQLRLSGAANNAGSAGGEQAAGADTAAAAAGGQQGASTAGSAQEGADVRADDSVAARKNLQEAQERVSTLEDNVKHLNQALQAQGAAASGLVVEGAKSLTQTFSDHKAASNGQQAASGSASSSAGEAGSPGTLANTTGSAGQTTGGASTGSASTGGNRRATQDADASPAAAGSANGAAAGTAGAAATAAGAASGQPSANASQGSAGSMAGDGQAANNAATAGSPGTGGAHGTNDAAAGSTAASGAADNGGSAADNAAGGSTNAASGSGNGASGSGNVAAGSGNVAAGSDSVASGSSSTPTAPGNAGSGSSNAPASSNGAAAGSSSAADSSKATEAGSTVSWIQEHMLGVITGVLAFIVLIIAWLLRRANAARDEGNGGLITEAMVREKLDQINLDFEQQSSDDAARKE